MMCGNEVLQRERESTSVALVYNTKTYVSMNVYTYIRTHIHACMHACMHACIHTYIHTHL